MKVKDVISLLTYGTRWILYGACSGKKLATSESSEKKKAEFADCDCPNSPIFTAIRPLSSHITNSYDCAFPVACIWVSGE